VTPFLLSLGIALVPGVYRWWTTRRFRGAADDPALAERWWTYRMRAVYVSTGSAALCGMLSPLGLVLTLPVLWIGSAIGGFRARRIVFGEQWSLGAYLVWTLRLVFGVWGFWIALALAPWSAMAGPGWTVPLALAALLGAWQHWYAAILRWCLSARPLNPEDESPALVEGFARVLGRSTIARPGVWRAGPPESTLANAVALPSFHEPSVLFSNALLAALSPAEVTAIFAHELAHLEHFVVRRQRWAMLAAPLLVVVGTLVLPRVMQSTWIVGVGWLVLLVVKVALRSRWRQENETASDRRAVELSGDAAALASGLTKLHALGRVPRRWSAALERRASHPSLARRLAAIRAPGDKPTAPPATTVVAGSDGSTWVTLEPDRVRHLTGVPRDTSDDPAALAAAARTAVSFSYGDLRELRVVATGASGVALQIRDALGRSWSCPLNARDVSRVQTALDAVDHLVTHASPRDSRAPLVGLGLSLAIALLALAAGLPGLGALAAITALVPSSGASLAAGLGALAIVVGTLTGMPWVAPHHAADLLLLVLLAGMSLVYAQRRRHAPTPPRAWVVPAALALATLCTWTVGALIAPSLLALHRLAVLSPAAAALPTALAGVLWALRVERRWTIVAVALAATPLAVASPWFSTFVVRDALMGPALTLPRRALQLTEIASGPAPTGAMNLRVSPNGRRFIVTIAGEDDEPSGQFVVGDVGAQSTTVTADDIEFADDESVLVLRHYGTTGTLTLHDIANLQTTRWGIPLAASENATLSTDPRARRWRVTARTRTELLRVDATLDGQRRSARWTLPSDSRSRWLASDGSQQLGLASRQGRNPWFRTYWLLYGLGFDVPTELTSFSSLDATGSHAIATTAQDGQCPEAPPGHSIVCLVTDGAETRLWRFDDGRLKSLGMIAGHPRWISMAPDGMLVTWAKGHDVIVDPDRREVLELEGDARRYGVGEWTSAGPSLGMLTSEDGAAARIVTFARQ
jgi:Zn-dependent protease with chaperone function